MIEKFHDVVKSQLDQLTKTIQQLKDLGNERGNTDLIIDMLKEKLHEWFEKLSPEEKAKHQNLDINSMVDQLMGANTDTTEKKGKKKHKKSEGKTREPQESSKLFS